MNWRRLQKQALRRRLRRLSWEAEQAQRRKSSAGRLGALRRAILRAACALTIVGIVSVVAKVDFRSPSAKRYAAFDKAYQQGDLRALEGMVAPDFHFDTPRGARVTRAKYIESLLTSLPRQGFYTKIEQVDDGDHDSTILIKLMLPDVDGKLHGYRYRDRWVERNHEWFLSERSRSWMEPHRL